jgi:iron(III) transport system ATP-binding protein
MTTAPASAAAPDPPGDAYLRLEGLTKRFGAFTAVEGVGLEVGAGEFVSVLGPSGCGKTTVLRMVAGLEMQTSGRIHLRGDDISTLPPAKRHCGIVFQSYALFPNLTAERNVAYGLNRRQTTSAERRERAREMLALVGLAEKGAKYPAQLSGGEQQRVALARALAPNPSLLLLDEPLSALDARVRVRLRAEIRSLQKRLGVTTLMVTHDQEEALTMADRVVVMSKGRLVQTDPPVRVYHHPADRFVADFIGAMNFLGPGTLEAPGAVRLGDHTLRTRDGHTGAAGSPVMAAIRPEDVALDAAAHGDTNVIPTRVESLEFRGAFYRVTLSLPGVESPPIHADVQPLLLERLGVGPGDDLTVCLPPERVLVFPPGEGP